MNDDDILVPRQGPEDKHGRKKANKVSRPPWELSEGLAARMFLVSSLSYHDYRERCVWFCALVNRPYGDHHSSKGYAMQCISKIERQLVTQHTDLFPPSGVVANEVARITVARMRYWRMGHQLTWCESRMLAQWVNKDHNDKHPISQQQMMFLLGRDPLWEDDIAIVSNRLRELRRDDVTQADLIRVMSECDHTKRLPLPDEPGPLHKKLINAIVTGAGSDAQWDIYKNLCEGKNELLSNTR